MNTLLIPDSYARNKSRVNTIHVVYQNKPVHDFLTVLSAYGN